MLRENGQNAFQLFWFFSSLQLLIQLSLIQLLTIRENGQSCIVKCSSSFYRNPPLSNERVKVRHLGLFLKSEKFKHPVLIEDEDDEEISESKKAKNLE